MSSRLLGLACVALGLAACSFEASDTAGASLEKNVCSVDADCGEGASCGEGGQCVARSVESGALSIVFEVTPQRLPDDSRAIPIVLEPFAVQGPVERTWQLPLPVTVGGLVREGEGLVAADLTFAPTRTLPGVAPRTIALSTADSAFNIMGDDFSVQLLADVEYRLVVQPADSRLPPVSRVFEAADGMQQDVDYATLPMHSLRFAVSGVPEGRDLMVRAYDRASGSLLSSTGYVIDGEVTLAFAEEPEAYRLVVRVDDGYFDATRDGVGPAYEACSRDSAAPLPELRIDSESLTADEFGVVQLELPAIPTLVRYEGSIELCDAPQARAITSQALVPAIAVALRSRGTQLQGEDSAWTATLNTSADATYESQTERFRFCLDAVPGEYELIATPPTSFPCELFAEQRTIVAPADGAATSALVQLESTAFLSGTVQTQGAQPIAGASVDAVSLARSQAVQLEDDGASLTGYNRSRQTISDAQGKFRLPIDIGSYDVTLKPPVGSGFAWQVHHDVTIGARDVDFANVIGMAPPVMLDCGLEYRDGGATDQASLMDAEITAYAVIVDATGVERAISVGKSVADAQGRFIMLIPPGLREGW